MIKATDIKFQWTADEVCFDCPCGTTEIILSESGEEKRCPGCGRVYRNIHYVAIASIGANDRIALSGEGDAYVHVMANED